MNAIESAINIALKSQGNDAKAVNKAYLEFIKANFIVPIDKSSKDEAPEVLFLNEKDQTFLPVFTSQTYLDNWACEIVNDIKILQLSGVDLLKGIQQHVTVCLNPGSTLYKSFNTSELARMRSMVLKLFRD